MKKEKIRVYLYTRVSTTMQIERYSLDAQKTKMKAFCDYNEYEIRGKRVLLDADLAEVYGYDKKEFNRQVKNNIEKFDEDFMLELTEEELEDLRYKNCTANISSKSRYNPHVFTEQQPNIILLL